MKSTISYLDAKAPQALPTDPIEPLPDHHPVQKQGYL